MTASTVLFNAQTIQYKDVPPLVQKSFYKQFPTVKEVKWEKENGNYEAGFKSKGTEISVLIDPSGNFLETEKEIEINALSVPIQKYITKNFPHRKIKEAAKITDAKGVVVYEVEINGQDLIFDPKGNFLRAIKN